MKSIRILPIIFIIAFAACSAPQKQVEPPPQYIPPRQGIITPTTAAVTITPAGVVPEQSGNLQPLYFFYVIHVHIASSDFAPYTSPAMTQIDATQAENMLTAIQGIAGILENHGAYGSFQVVAGTSRGLCEFEGSNNIFQRLVSAGHEVSVHVHDLDDLQAAYDNLRVSCGLTAESASGFLTEVGQAGSGLAQQIFSNAIREAHSLGMSYSTENMSPGDALSPFADICNNQLGVGNSMWAQTGNLLFPWKPDYMNNNVCEENPQGDFALVDHVSISWMMSGNKQMPDLLGTSQFEVLKQDLSAAMEYLQSHRSTRPAAWGFVTHIIEYSAGNQAENLPDQHSLAALDEFLSYADTFASQGRLVYATAGQIAQLVFSGE